MRKLQRRLTHGALILWLEGAHRFYVWWNPSFCMQCDRPLHPYEGNHYRKHIH